MRIKVARKGVVTELKDCGDADFEIWTVMTQGGFEKRLEDSVESLVAIDGSTTNEVAALEEGGRYRLEPAKVQEPIPVSPFPGLAQVDQEGVWQSVLRIQEEAKHGMDPKWATALVFDIHQGYMYVLVSLHFVAGFFNVTSRKFQRKIRKWEEMNNELRPERFFGDRVQLIQVDAYGTDFDVMTFRMFPDDDLCWKAKPKRGYCILKVALDSTWNCSIRGQARRQDAVLSQPSKRKAPETYSLTRQICKTPSFCFTLHPTQPIQAFGFPKVAAGRCVLSSSIASVRRLDFLVQGLASEGLPGGAVIATTTGQVLGYWGGYDGSGGDQFLASAYKAIGFPARLSFLDQLPPYKPRLSRMVLLSATKDKIVIQKKFDQQH